MDDFHAAKNISRRHLAFVVKHPNLFQVACGLISNTHQVHLLARNAADLVGASHFFCKLQATACFDVTGQPFPKESEKTALIEERISELFKNDTIAHMEEEKADRVVAILATMIPGKFGDALRALLAAQLIAAWTCFECLAGDLWVAAVNANPHILGVRAFEAETPGHNKSKYAGINLNLLKRHRFDLSDKLGSHFKEDNKFPMDGLKGIKAAYRAIFNESDNPGLSNTFQQVSTLEACRNVLVHRGGRIDPRFLSRTSNDPDYNSLPPDSILPLNGSANAKLASAAIELCVELFEFVDNWLVANA